MNHKQKYNQGVLFIDDPLYPALLKKIDDPPEKLYYRGDISDGFEKTLSVVGTRRITMYGKKMCNTLLTPLIKAGVSIVSGFAIGVDIYAHLSVLSTLREAGVFGNNAKHSKPIVVMPSGLDCPTPIENARYIEPLLNIGAIFLSEYEDNHQPFKWTYPRRNRIIAGLSRATLIIEAQKEGGSMNSAEQCMRYGRQLLVVPGNVDSKSSEGCNELIKKGARVVTSHHDISEHFFPKEANLNKIVTFRRRDDLSDIQNSIVEKLLHSSLTLDQLSRELKIDIAKLSVEISFLQLKDLILNSEGKYYAC